VLKFDLCDRRTVRALCMLCELAKLSASECKRLRRGLVLKPSLGKEDLARCADLLSSAE
jgi:hypothetical protein